eukprot:superscaffoldBa00000948_g8140
MGRARPDSQQPMPACENTLLIGSALALMKSYPALFTDVTGWTEPIIGNGSSQHYNLFINEPISLEGRHPWLQAPATKPSAHNAGHVFAAASTAHHVKPAPGVNTPAVSSMDGVTVNADPHFGPASLSIYSGGHVDGEHEVLLVGDSIIQFVEVPNGITYCLQGAKILDIIELVPALIDRHLTALIIIVHLGTNETGLRQSVKLPQGFETLAETIESLGEICIFSGPIPTLRKSITLMEEELCLKTPNPKYGHCSSTLRLYDIWLGVTTLSPGLSVAQREKVGPPLGPALPNTSMQGSLESGVRQHKDQGYSGAASLPSADRKGLMRRGTHHS